MDQFTATIRDVAVQGMGVVDAPDGRVFFVRGGVPGDKVTLKILGFEKRYGFAEIQSIVEASPDRVSPPCRYHGHSDHDCQGCPWQMATYEAQLRWKDRAVRYMFERNRLLNPDTLIHSIKGSPKILQYRNRAQFKTDGLKLGYVDGSKSVIDIDRCLVLNEPANQHLQELRSQLPQVSWKPGEGFDWNFFDIDDVAGTSSMNRRLSFRQANDEQNAWMKTWIGDRVPKKAPLLELFCGNGNFTEVLANYDRQTIAVEANEIAIEQLQQKNLPRTDALSMDLFRMGPLNVLRKLNPDIEILFLDPPRAGFKKLSFYTEAFKKLRRVVYVSCDLSTFSYDAHMLVKQGWRLHECQPLDQFPHTPHIELLVTFTR